MLKPSAVCRRLTIEWKITSCLFAVEGVSANAEGNCSMSSFDHRVEDDIVPLRHTGGSSIGTDGLRKVRRKKPMSRLERLAAKAQADKVRFPMICDGCVCVRVCIWVPSAHARARARGCVCVCVCVSCVGELCEPARAPARVSVPLD
jgi:hypothetical protein